MSDRPLYWNHDGLILFAPKKWRLFVGFTRGGRKIVAFGQQELESAIEAYEKEEDEARAEAEGEDR